MSTPEVLSWVVLAIILAVIAERLFSHFCRRADDECSRLDAAIEAIEDQQKTLDALLARESVPPLVKSYLILFAGAAITKRGARAFLRVVRGERFEPTGDMEARMNEFAEKTNELRQSDPEAYELYRTFIFRVPIMAFLQHSETYKALGQLSLRLAEEREPATTRDVAIMAQEYTRRKPQHLVAAC